MRNVFGLRILLFNLAINTLYAEEVQKPQETPQVQAPVPYALQYYDDEEKKLEEQNRIPSSPQEENKEKP